MHLPPPPEIERLKPTHCPACSYDLRGNESGKCPECGQDIDPQSADK
jgi:predicted Zn-ribbon and HTH transcriptional regulator